MSLKLQAFRKRVAFASLPTGFSWPGPAQASKMPLLQSASLEPWETPTIGRWQSYSPSKMEIPKGGKDPTNQDWPKNLLCGLLLKPLKQETKAWKLLSESPNSHTATLHFHFHICSSGTSGASPAPAPGKSVFRSLLKLTSYLSESNIRKYRWLNPCLQDCPSSSCKHHGVERFHYWRLSWLSSFLVSLWYCHSHPLSSFLLSSFCQSFISRDKLETLGPPRHSRALHQNLLEGVKKPKIQE